MPPRTIKSGAPPPEELCILVTLISTTRQVCVTAIVEDDESALVNLGPYVFETHDIAENLALGMQAAEILREKYGVTIYIHERPTLYRM